MPSKHGVLLLVAQVLIFVAALFFGFRILSPRADEPKIDLPAITFNTARVALGYAARHGRFASTEDLIRSMPMLPVGVGVELRSTDSANAVIETRFRRRRCVLQLHAGDTSPGRPDCR